MSKKKMNYTFNYLNQDLLAIRETNRSIQRRHNLASSVWIKARVMCQEINSPPTAKEEYKKEEITVSNIFLMDGIINWPKLTVFEDEG